MKTQQGFIGIVLAVVLTLIIGTAIASIVVQNRNPETAVLTETVEQLKATTTPAVVTTTVVATTTQATSSLFVLKDIMVGPIALAARQDAPEPCQNTIDTTTPGSGYLLNAKINKKVYALAILKSVCATTGTTTHLFVFTKENNKVEIFGSRELGSGIIVDSITAPNDAIAVVMHDEETGVSKTFIFELKDGLVIKI
ncbi:MAG: hypothetical protein RL094_755 [Candidatus Parcubacteria bacterium]|jgi:hypothetical protein